MDNKLKEQNEEHLEEQIDRMLEIAPGVVASPEVLSAAVYIQSIWLADLATRVQELEAAVHGKEQG